MPPFQKVSESNYTHFKPTALELSKNPWLLDHVIGGYPVVPMTCAIAWLGNELEQLYPGHTIHTINDFKVVKGIIYDSNQRNTALIVNEISKTDDHIVVEAKLISETNDKEIVHYQGTYTFGSQLPDPPKFGNVKLAEQPEQDRGPFYGDGRLFHKKAFEGIQSILDISPETITLKCIAPVLDEAYQGQLPIKFYNPYAGDIQFQGILILLKKYAQAGALPVLLGKGINYRTVLPGEEFFASLDIIKRTSTRLVANCTAYDRDGILFNRSEKAMCAVSKSFLSKFQSKLIVDP